LPLITLNELFKAINRHITLSPSLKQALEERLSSVVFKKREVVLHPHQVCTKSYFIQEGILRLYYYKEEKEITEFFSGVGEWVNSPRSFMSRQPDIYYLDAVQETKAWTLHVEDLLYLFEHFPEMERYSRMDMGSIFIHLMDRLHSLRFSTAKDKYLHFLASYPDIHHHIPLGMAASYIGITQETLSRLRRPKK